MTELCRVLEVSGGGYYAWLKRPVSDRRKKDLVLSTKIVNIFEGSKQRYGSPRVHQALKNQGESVSRKRVIKLMSEEQIAARGKRKFKSTTDSMHNKVVSKNLVKQQFSVSKANTVWAGDITYVKTGEGWLYLAVVLDLYSRRVIGWSMSERINRQLVMDAFTMAYLQRKPQPGLIFHSDRGSQYASDDFQKLLKKLNYKSSMSGKGNCYDNAVVESFFHTLKVELVYSEVYQARTAAKASIFEYIELFYNKVRMHSTLGYCSPIDFEGQCGARLVA